MKADQERTSPPPIGATSLLTVFAVLCLSVFALLTLSDVRADARLADTAHQAVLDYYAADCRAQETLARLRGGEQPENVSLTRLPEGQFDYLCAYACPVSDALELQVEVNLADGGAYQVLRWQLASTGNWQGQSNVHLWDGTLPQ